MSLYCKVRVTREQFEVVLLEMESRGVVMNSCNDKFENDFNLFGCSDIKLGWNGSTIVWAGGYDLEVMEFEKFMARLDAGIPPLRAFRKVHTYTMNE